MKDLSDILPTVLRADGERPARFARKLLKPEFEDAEAEQEQEEEIEFCQCPEEPEESCGTSETVHGTEVAKKEPSEKINKESV